MGWKGNIVEVPVWVGSRFAKTSRTLPDEPRSLFVFRNNDLGDLLVTTPLFEALRRRFPRTKIVAGVGAWNVETLRNNPHVDEVMVVNAPWNNKYVAPQRTRDVFRYIWSSPEAKAIAERQLDIGIDVLGSHVGSVLMMRARIPYRLGVRGYRGGHTAVQKYVRYNEQEHVGRSALRFAELLGATELPECRPQIFLSASEQETGAQHWRQQVLEPQTATRIVIGPGAGFPEKSWPVDYYRQLVELLAKQGQVEIRIVGGNQDREIGKQLAAITPAAQSLAGELSLREMFAVVSNSHLVVTNPSMLMHVAAAFRIPTLVLLGDYFQSASHHDMQWGYPETCWSLGRDKGRDNLYEPEEVLEFMRRKVPQFLGSKGTA